MAHDCHMAGGFGGFDTDPIGAGAQIGLQQRVVSGAIVGRRIKLGHERGRDGGGCLQTSQGLDAVEPAVAHDKAIFALLILLEIEKARRSGLQGFQMIRGDGWHRGWRFAARPRQHETPRLIGCRDMQGQGAAVEFAFSSDVTTATGWPLASLPAIFPLAGTRTGMAMAPV